MRGEIEATHSFDFEIVVQPDNEQTKNCNKPDILQSDNKFEWIDAHMNLTPAVHIEKIDQLSSLLVDVRRLWRANSATLGFFPDGAFKDYASKGNILVALSDLNECIGYILYRISKSNVVIVHLCVADDWQQRGVAKALVLDLSSRTKEYRGMSLNCRRDFPVSKLWPRLGFVALADRQGRSREGKELTFWWYSHNHANIFTLADTISLESKISVVIDANIFFDIELERNGSEESRALLADWLQSSIELCLTPEIHNEINRNPDSEGRQRMHNNVMRYVIIDSKNDEFDEIVGKLQDIPWEPKTERDWSDLRQIARAIDANIQFFVSRDDEILQKAEDLYDSFNLTVLRPSDLIIHIDELQREKEYQPVRLNGSSFVSRQPNTKEQEKLSYAFQLNKSKEARTDFLKKIRYFQSNPRRYHIEIATDDSNEYIGMIVWENIGDNGLTISMIRLTDSVLSETLIRHLLQKKILSAASNQRHIIRITDPLLDERVVMALIEEGFLKLESYWIKITLECIETVQGIKNKVLSLKTHQEEEEYFNNLVKTLEDTKLKTDTIIGSDLESFLWPAKIIDLFIPTYIIPIKPHWAVNLFDENLAVRTLFGADANLALNTEAVYYRSARPSAIFWPARILWYVSQDREYEGSGSIRACSRLDEVIVSPPKEIFRRFRRLGVYQWKNVFEVAKHDISNKIMALRFSQTHLMKSPVKWRVIQKILQDQNCPSQLQSPHKISPSAFVQLITKGNESSNE